MIGTLNQYWRNKDVCKEWMGYMDTHLVQMQTKANRVHME